MIDIDLALKEFIKYSEEFDLSRPEIKRKQLHSLRVMKISKEIAESLDLDEEKIKLATLIGLLHDIARFEQFTQFETFHDAQSFDHGDYGASILEKDIRKYIKNDKYDDIIITAVKNHNKYEINPELKDEKLLYSKLIRDADKIDIIFECVDVFWKNNESKVEKSVILDSIFEEVKQQKLIKRTKEYQLTESEKLLGTIAFIFDINFRKSFEILKQENYINKMVDRFNFENKDTNTKWNILESS